MTSTDNRGRWTESFADPTGAAFLRVVAEAVVLDGSIFAQPIIGGHNVWTALRTAAENYDTSATALGLSIGGVTVLTVDDEARFAAVAIHHRPLGAVLAFSREMGRRLAGQIAPGHFHGP
jgi:hypothetical protein